MASQLTVINTHTNGYWNMATTIEHYCFALYSYNLKNITLKFPFQNNHRNSGGYVPDVIVGVLSAGVFRIAGGFVLDSYLPAH